jgi:hypothetical protein
MHLSAISAVEVGAVQRTHCLFAKMPPVMVVPLLPPRPTSIILHLTRVISQGGIEMGAGIC